MGTDLEDTALPWVCGHSPSCTGIWSVALAMILMAGWSRESVEPGAKPFPSHDLGGSQPQGPQRGWVQPAQCGLVCRPCIPSTHWSMSPLPSKPQLLQNFPQKARTHPPDALGPRVSKAGPSPELLLWSAPNLGYSTEWGGTLGRCRGPFLPAPPPPDTDPGWKGVSLPAEVVPAYPICGAGQGRLLGGPQTCAPPGTLRAAFSSPAEGGGLGSLTAASQWQNQLPWGLPGFRVHPVQV